MLIYANFCHWKILEILVTTRLFASGVEVGGRPLGVSLIHFFPVLNFVKRQPQTFVMYYLKKVNK